MPTTYITGTGVAATDGTTLANAIAAATTGDTIQITDSLTYEWAGSDMGAKVLTIQGAVGQRPLFRPVGGGPSATRCLYNPGAGSTVQRVHIYGYTASGSFQNGGAVNGNGLRFHVLDVWFQSCTRAVQHVGGSVGNVNRLEQIKAWDVAQALQRADTGYLQVRNCAVSATGAAANVWDTISGANGTFDYVSVYQVSSGSANDRAIATPDATTTIRNCAYKRSASGATAAFFGTVSYCTALNATSVWSIIDGGNNTLADPLWTAATANPPDFSTTALSTLRGTAVDVVGITTDLVGTFRPPGASDRGALQVPDTTAPTVSTVTYAGGTFTVTFSETVDETSAELAASYGLPVTFVATKTAATVVTLALTSVPTDPFELRIFGVTDSSGNLVTAWSRWFQFGTGAAVTDGVVGTTWAGETFPGIAGWDPWPVLGEPATNLRAVLFGSLFSDARAQDGDLVGDVTEERRGWWADGVEGRSTSSGSRLWTLFFKPTTTLREIQDFAREALQHLIDDGVAEQIDVTAIRDGTVIAIVVDVIARRGRTTERFASLWSPYATG